MATSVDPNSSGSFSGDRRSVVFVHGAWHGGWCWQRVAAILERRGHGTFAPTLAGLGERQHLLSRDVTLDEHIQDVVEVFRREQLEDAILCCHSHGGWAASGALEHVESHVSAIVFVDAHLPQDGECAFETSNGREQIENDWANGEVFREVPDVNNFVVRPANRQWIADQLTPQPLGAYFQPIRLTGARERIPSRLYIRATQYGSRSFDDNLKWASKNGWQVLEKHCGHEVMVDEPEWLADVLSGVA